MMLKSMASHDPKDTTSVDAPVPDYEAVLGKGVKGLTGRRTERIPRRRHVEGDPEALGRWRRVAEGCGSDDPRHFAAAHQICASRILHRRAAECSSNLARYDGMRYGLRVSGDESHRHLREDASGGFGKEVRRRILIGTYVLSAGYYDAYYLKAQKVRTLIKRDFDEAWKNVDVVLTPTTPSPAFAFGEKTGRSAGDVP